MAAGVDDVVPDARGRHEEVSDLVALGRRARLRRSTRAASRTTGQRVATSTSPSAGSRCGSAKESQTHPPHHRTSRPITEKPIGTEANGCAITIRPAGSRTMCRDVANARRPASITSGSTISALASSRVDGGAPLSTYEW